MQRYKEDQGRIVRLAAFWLLIFLLLFGCFALHRALPLWFAKIDEPLGGTKVPLVGWALSIDLIICAVLFGAGAYLVFRWLESPKQAELLIETETELKKVTWPTGKDVINSSLVVILSVMFLMGFLAGTDWLLGRFMQRLLLG